MSDKVRSPNNEINMANTIDIIFNNPKYSNIILKFGDKYIYAINDILIKTSSVFNGMLGKKPYGSFIESNKIEIEIHHPDTSFDAFQLFIKYLYGCEIEMNYTLTNEFDIIYQLLYLSQYYMIDSLTDKLISYIEININNDNFNDIYKNTINLQNDKLTAIYMQYYTRVFNKDIVFDDFILSLNVDMFCNIISIKNILINEEDLFALVCKWIEIKNLSAIDIEKIMSRIRFPLMSAKFLYSVIKPSKFNLINYYYEALEFKTNCLNTDNISIKFIHRLCGLFFAIGGLNKKYEKYRLVDEKDIANNMFNNFFMNNYRISNGIKVLESVKYANFLSIDKGELKINGYYVMVNRNLNLGDVVQINNISNENTYKLDSRHRSGNVALYVLESLFQ